MRHTDSADARGRYQSPAEEVAFGAAGIWNSGSDLTTLWTTPHPNGTSTIIHDTATTSGEGFFSERTMVWDSLGPG